MEFVKKSDIRQLLDQLMKEPAYQHTGEDFYVGISAVDCGLQDLSVYDIDIIKYKVETYE